MIRLVVILCVISLPAFAELKDSCVIPSNCTEGECYDHKYCIERYKDLESYITQNDDILVNLTEGFFKTGRDTAEFVTITYHYQVPNTTDENNNTCFAQRSVYFGVHHHHSCLDLPQCCGFLCLLLIQYNQVLLYNYLVCKETLRKICSLD